jgi:hypothetical protein
VDKILIGVVVLVIAVASGVLLLGSETGDDASRFRGCLTDGGGHVVTDGSDLRPFAEDLARGQVRSEGASAIGGRKDARWYVTFGGPEDGYRVVAIVRDPSEAPSDPASEAAFARRLTADPGSFDKVILVPKSGGPSPASVVTACDEQVSKPPPNPGT